jgi:hypothetical protein
MRRVSKAVTSLHAGADDGDHRGFGAHESGAQGGIALSSSVRSPPLQQSTTPIGGGARPASASPPLHHAGIAGITTQHAWGPETGAPSPSQSQDSVSPTDVTGSPIRGSAAAGASSTLRGAAPGGEALRSPSGSVSPSSPQLQHLQTLGSPTTAAAAALAASTPGSGQRGAGAGSPAGVGAGGSRAAMIAAANSEAFPLAVLSSPSPGRGVESGPGGARTPPGGAGSPGQSPNSAGSGSKAPGRAGASPDERKEGDAVGVVGVSHAHAAAEPRPTLSLLVDSSHHAVVATSEVASIGLQQQTALKPATVAAAVDFVHVPLQGGRGRGKRMPGERCCNAGRMLRL